MHVVRTWHCLSTFHPDVYKDQEVLSVNHISMLEHSTTIYTSVFTHVLYNTLFIESISYKYRKNLHMHSTTNQSISQIKEQVVLVITNWPDRSTSRAMPSYGVGIVGAAWMPGRRLAHNSSHNWNHKVAAGRFSFQRPRCIRALRCRHQKDQNDQQLRTLFYLQDAGHPWHLSFLQCSKEMSKEKQKDRERV